MSSSSSKKELFRDRGRSTSRLPDSATTSIGIGQRDDLSDNKEKGPLLRENGSLPLKVNSDGDLYLRHGLQKYKGEGIFLGEGNVRWMLEKAGKEGGWMAGGYLAGTYTKSEGQRRATIKRDGCVEPQISEVLASRIINDILPGSASEVELVKAALDPGSQEFKERGRRWEDIYVASLHHPKFDSVLSEHDEIKAAYGGYFEPVLYATFAHRGSSHLESKFPDRKTFFDLISLQKALIADLLVANNDMHLGNMVVFKKESGGLGIQAFDFGAAFNLTYGTTNWRAVNERVAFDFANRGTIRGEFVNHLVNYPASWTTESVDFWRLVTELGTFTPDLVKNCFSYLLQFYETEVLLDYLQQHCFLGQHSLHRKGDQRELLELLITQLANLMDSRLENFKAEAAEKLYCLRNPSRTTFLEAPLEAGAQTVAVGAEFVSRVSSRQMNRMGSTIAQLTREEVGLLKENGYLPLDVNSDGKLCLRRNLGDYKGHDIFLGPDPRGEVQVRWVLEKAGKQGGWMKGGELAGTYWSMILGKRATIKRDGQPDPQIREVLASRIINDILPGSACEVQLARAALDPEDFKKRGRRWEDTYVASLHHPKFDSVLSDREEIKAAYGGYFEPVLYATRALRGSSHLESKFPDCKTFFDLTSLQKALIADLLVANNDMHLGNMVVFKTESGGFGIQAFDFGAAFNLSRHQHWRATNERVAFDFPERGMISGEFVNHLVNYPASWTTESVDFWRLVKELGTFTPGLVENCFNYLSKFYETNELLDFLQNHCFLGQHCLGLEGDEELLKVCVTQLANLMDHRLANFKAEAAEILYGLHEGQAPVVYNESAVVRGESELNLDDTAEEHSENREPGSTAPL